jgi:hypothetical protein
METLRRYTGQISPPEGAKDCFGQTLHPYLPSPELVEAVNLAIYLKRPLLLRGDPGSGKTDLARAIAYELDLDLEIWCGELPPINRGLPTQSVAFYLGKITSLTLRR